MNRKTVRDVLVRAETVGKNLKAALSKSEKTALSKMAKKCAGRARIKLSREPLVPDFASMLNRERVEWHRLSLRQFSENWGLDCQWCSRLERRLALPRSETEFCRVARAYLGPRVKSWSGLRTAWRSALKRLPEDLCEDMEKLLPAVLRDRHDVPKSMDPLGTFGSFEDRVVVEAHYLMLMAVSGVLNEMGARGMSKEALSEAAQSVLIETDKFVAGEADSTLESIVRYATALGMRWELKLVPMQSNEALPAVKSGP